VGDSVTFGMGETSPYPQHLKELLSRKYGPRFEVFNMSVVGYNSIQEVELVRSKALRFDPDLLIIGYVLNDNKEDGGDGGLSRYFKQSGSRAYDWLRKSVKRLRRHLGKDVTTEAFEELAGLAAERRLPVVVVIFPGSRSRRTAATASVRSTQRCARSRSAWGSRCSTCWKRCRSNSSRALRGRAAPQREGARGRGAPAAGILELGPGVQAGPSTRTGTPLGAGPCPRGGGGIQFARRETTAQSHTARAT
jgi:hypothetical protein